MSDQTDPGAQRSWRPSRRRSWRPSRRRSAATLWRRAIAVLLVFLVVVGGGALALTRYQADDFASTTSQFERELGVLAALQQELLEASDPMSAVLYEFDAEGSPEQRWQRWQGYVATIDGRFSTLTRQGSRPEAFRRAASRWHEVVDGVAEARQQWGSGEVAAALADGADPFGPTVWQSYNDTQFMLASLSAASVADLRAGSNQASDRQATAQAAFAATAVIAVLFGVTSARRLSRRVIGPLISLRHSVAELQRGDLAAPIEVPAEASSEVADLAGAVASMAAAVQTSQARLQEQAYTDDLTGLANRRAFAEALDARFEAGRGACTAVLLVDIDDFKDVNDSLGHAAGDALLRTVARRLAQMARPGDLVARIGGDEFALVLEADEPLAVAAPVSERVLAALGEAVAVEGHRVRVSGSVGIASGRGAVTGDDLVRHADVTMYAAKRRGKDRVEVFHQPTHDTTLI